MRSGIDTVVQKRRRVVFRIGVAGIAICSGAATACIFDKGEDFQGGGRLGRPATAQFEKPEPTDTNTGGGGGDFTCQTGGACRCDGPGGAATGPSCCDPDSPTCTGPESCDEKCR